jgi:hypothetical protein
MSRSAQASDFAQKLICRRIDPNPQIASRVGIIMGHSDRVGAKMNQWLLNLPVLESYLIAIPAIMAGSILLLGGIVLLLEPRHENGGSRSE